MAPPKDPEDDADEPGMLLDIGDNPNRGEAEEMDDIMRRKGGGDWDGEMPDSFYR